MVENLFLEVIRAFYSYCHDVLGSDLKLSYTQSGNLLVRYEHITHLPLPWSPSVVPSSVVSLHGSLFHGLLPWSSSVVPLRSPPPSSPSMVSSSVVPLRGPPLFFINCEEGGQATGRSTMAVPL